MLSGGEFDVGAQGTGRTVPGDVCSSGVIEGTRGDTCSVDKGEQDDDSDTLVDGNEVGVVGITKSGVILVGDEIETRGEDVRVDIRFLRPFNRVFGGVNIGVNLLCLVI